MLICELQFETPDRDQPLYSLQEVDYYAWIPHSHHMLNHRLSLRKNLGTGEFEIYRRYYGRVVAVGPGLIASTSKDTGQEDVAFRGSFEEALEFGNQEYERWHGKRDRSDEPCPHLPAKHALGCPKFRYRK